jgi:methyl-accepting chemotaxis protein
MIVLLLLSLFLVANNILNIRNFRSDVGALAYAGKHRVAYPILYQIRRLTPSEGDGRAAGELRERIVRTDQHLNALLAGDPALGVQPETDPLIRSNIQERRRLWEAEIKPALEQLIAMSPQERAAFNTAPLEDNLRRFAAMVDAAFDLRERSQVEELERLQTLQWVFSAILTAVLALVFWFSQQIVRRTRSLAAVAEKISAGDLHVTAPVEGRDELFVLGSSFNDMTANLRDKIEVERKGRESLEAALTAIADTTNSLSSAAAEILAGSSQQAAGMREQASAVAETVTTVEEVQQTSEQAADRANSVFESSQRAADVSSSGRKAIDDTVELMADVQVQSKSMAEGILRLAEHSQEIGEIIAAVTDIADQTNLLAVNASIEASRAGEHGKGFTVVASEIKDLADQSKKATAQIRQILGEIQKATNSAVLATEESSKSVDRALNAVNDGGETIRSLEQTISEAARAAAQIAASAAQQSTGMTQIQQAMAHINQASSQNLAATKQTEQAAQDLNALGQRLQELLTESGR